MVIEQSGEGSLESRMPSRDIILIGIDEDVEDKGEAAKKHLPDGGEIVRVNETLSYVAAALPSGTTADQQKGSLESNPEIRYAEDNYRGRVAYTPDDPYYGQQYAPQMVNAPEAWDDSTGSSDVTIAVLDTGIKYDHPDLAPNMDDSVSNHGYDFVSIRDDSKDRDSDPYPDDLHGPEVDGDASESHGTHVAGILGAATDNGTGVAGISDSSLMSVRVVNQDGFGYYADWADGIQWATDEGADIINMSLGGSNHSETLSDAVSYARTNGVLLVAAAGNDGKEKDVYPASYSEVIAVTALDQDGSFASYSNYGDHVELTAPGSAVLSTYPTDDSTGEPADTYDYLWGTSMATPVVAGVAGLVLSYDESLSVTELRTVLKTTAEDIGLSAKKQGAGRIDAHAALEHVIGTTSVSVGDHSTTPGGTVDIAPSGSNVEKIVIEDLWTDWSVTGSQSDGGSFTDDVSSLGKSSFEWSNTQKSSSPTITVDLPDRYAGGDFVITIRGSRPGATEKTTATVSIS